MGHFKYMPDCPAGTVNYKDDSECVSCEEQNGISCDGGKNWLLNIIIGLLLI